MKEVPLWDKQFDSPNYELPDGDQLATHQGKVKDNWLNRQRVKENQRYLFHQINKEQVQKLSQELRTKQRARQQLRYDHSTTEFKANHPRTVSQAEERVVRRFKLVRQSITVVVVLILLVISGETIQQGMIGQSLSLPSFPGQHNNTSIDTKSLKAVNKDTSDRSSQHKKASKTSQQAQQSKKPKTSQQTSQSAKKSQTFNVTGTTSQLSQPMSNGNSLNYGATYHFANASDASLWANAQESFWKAQGYKSAKFSSDPNGGVNLTFDK